MEIQLCKVNTHFPGHFTPIILANHIKFNYGEIIGMNEAGKCALTSHCGISITDRIQNNEQNKSFVTGPLYVHSEFEAI